MRSPAVGCEMKSFNENGQNVSDTHGGCDIFIPQNRIKVVTSTTQPNAPLEPTAEKRGGSEVSR